MANVQSAFKCGLGETALLSCCLSLNESFLPQVKLIQYKLRRMSKHYGVVFESMIKMQTFSLLFGI